MDPTQKKTAETFDSYESRYSDAVNRAVSFTGLNVDVFTRVKADYIIDLATSAFGSTSKLKVLDIGCGIGNFHGLVAPKVGDMNGVDISAASIAKAKERYPHVNYRVYEGTRLPYEDQSFDLAFAICVMHHVPPADWPVFAGEMFRVVKSGGMALVFEHNPVNPFTMRAVNDCPFDEDATLLRSSKTAALFETAGFLDLKSRFILSIPSVNSVLRSVDRIFSRIPFGAQYYVSAKKP